MFVCAATFRDVPLAFFAATQKASSFFTVSDQPPYGTSMPGVGGRGRDGDFSPPPAQIPAGAANAPGFHLGW